MKAEVLKLKWNEIALTKEPKAMDTESGVLVPMGADEKMLILIKNTGGVAAEVSIKAGDGIQATEDTVLSVPGNGEAAVSVESGKFLITKGENKGNILLTGASENLEIRAIELP